MDEKITIYYAKSKWDNEYCCPYCGIEMLPTYIYSADKEYFYPNRMIDFCKKCDKVFFIERIYLSIKETDRNDYELKERKWNR